MRLLPSSSLLLLFLPLFSTAQPNDMQHRGVLGITDLEAIDQIMIVMPGLGSNSRDMLREQSVKPYLMPPRKRLSNGSDNAYVLASCLEFYVNFDDNFKVNLSPEYIALNLREDRMEEAIRFLAQTGTVSAAIMPYGARSIPDGVRATSTYKILNFLHLYRKESKGRQVIFETKKALMRGNPVLVEMAVPATMQNLNGVRVWESNATKPEQIKPFLIVGYNEEMAAFEMLSCWGNEWGHNGYLWVPYDDFSKLVENGFVLVPEE